MDPHRLHVALAGPPSSHPRWSLARIRAVVPSLQCYSLAGVYHCLRRAGIRRKRGREYIHSPDPDYRAKEQGILAGRQEAQAHYGQVVLLYGDEKSYYRQPSLSCDYYPMGLGQPLARRSHRSNTLRRIVAALDAVSGQVVYRQASRIRLKVFQEFLRDLRAAYPGAAKLYLVLDNWWTVHEHPQVKELAAQLGISLLFLPTYAPWLNFIEKLWRWLCQEVLHLHRLAEDWPGLQAAVSHFLDQFAEGGSADCQALLHYVGLAPIQNIILSC